VRSVSGVHPAVVQSDCWCTAHPMSETGQKGRSALLPSASAVTSCCPEAAPTGVRSSFETSRKRGRSQQPRGNLLEQLQRFTADTEFVQCETSGVAARPRKAGDNPSSTAGYRLQFLACSRWQTSANGARRALTGIISAPLEAFSIDFSLHESAYQPLMVCPCIDSDRVEWFEHSHQSAYRNLKGV
jgi:hypothetical protein